MSCGLVDYLRDARFGVFENDGTATELGLKEIMKLLVSHCPKRTYNKNINDYHEVEH